MRPATLKEIQLFLRERHDLFQHKPPHDFITHRRGQRAEVVVEVLNHTFATYELHQVHLACGVDDTFEEGVGGACVEKHTCNCEFGVVLSAVVDNMHFSSVVSSIDGVFRGSMEVELQSFEGLDGVVVAVEQGHGAEVLDDNEGVGVEVAGSHTLVVGELQTVVLVVVSTDLQRVGQVDGRLIAPKVAEPLPVLGVLLVVVGVVREQQVRLVSRTVVVDSGQMRAVVMHSSSHHTHY